MRATGPRIALIVGVVTVLVAAAAVPTVIYLRKQQEEDRRHRSEQAFRTAAEGFAAAWRTGRLDGVAYQGTAGTEVARQVKAAVAGLRPVGGRPATVDLLGTDGPTGAGTPAGTGTVRLALTWDLGNPQRWKYETSATLVAVGETWSVKWTPAVLHPQLRTGQVFTTVRTPAKRAQIVGARGEVISSPTKFARAVIGIAGPATKEIVNASKGRVKAGDTTGLSGLQRSYDARLAGTAGIQVRPADVAADGSTKPVAGDPLFEVPPVDGEQVTLSLDSKIQLAAEATLTGATKPAGLVAIRVSTGEVLAAANGGPNAAGYNRALIGRYPPGSTMKVSTAFALLQTGITPSTAVNCPPTIQVDGRTFQNSEGEKLGSVPFLTDFAQSCNTAFIGSATKISAAQLHDAAASLGYGAPNTLGAPAYTGDVPTKATATEHAADAIGQGVVLASPLTVASVSASVGAGRFNPPKLVLDPAPATAAEPGPALPAEAIGQLRTLMRQVVLTGTGTALKAVPGGPVYGKTGTAEFGSASPPLTHAWFTGYQGDIAFALVVEGGGFGGKVAAPLVADFLTRLAAAPPAG